MQKHALAQIYNQSIEIECVDFHINYVHETKESEGCGVAYPESAKAAFEMPGIGDNR